MGLGRDSRVQPSEVLYNCQHSCHPRYCHPRQRNSHLRSHVAVTTHFDTVREHLAPLFLAVACTVFAFLTASSELLVNITFQLLMLTLSQSIVTTSSQSIFTTYSQSWPQTVSQSSQITSFFPLLQTPPRSLMSTQPSSFYAITTTASNSARPCESSASMCQSMQGLTYNVKDGQCIFPCQYTLHVTKAPFLPFLDGAASTGLVPTTSTGS